MIGKKFRTRGHRLGREIRFDPDGKPGVSNLIEILSVATGDPVGRSSRATTAPATAQFKADVGEAVVSLLEPIQQRYSELRADDTELRRLLALGAEKARAASAPTLESMYERMGFVRPG